MTKHGNPAGGPLSFSCSLNDDKIILSQKNNKLLRTILFATESNIYRACKAGLDILDRNNLKFDITKDNLDKIHSNVSDFYSKELYDFVMEYIKQQNPEIEELDREIDRLENEKDKCRKRMNRLEEELKLMEKEFDNIN